MSWEWRAVAEVAGVHVGHNILASSIVASLEFMVLASVTTPLE